MVDAATQFKKTGFSEEDSAQLARVATMFQNVADSELDAGDAAGFITSQLKAFNLDASEAEHIIDGVYLQVGSYRVNCGNERAKILVA